MPPVSSVRLRRLSRGSPRERNNPVLDYLDRRIERQELKNLQEHELKLAEERFKREKEIRDRQIDLDRRRVELSEKEWEAKEQERIEEQRQGRLDSLTSGQRTHDSLTPFYTELANIYYSNGEKAAIQFLQKNVEENPVVMVDGQEVPLQTMGLRHLKYLAETGQPGQVRQKSLREEEDSRASRIAELASAERSNPVLGNYVTELENIYRTEGRAEAVERIDAIIESTPTVPVMGQHVKTRDILDITLNNLDDESAELQDKKDLAEFQAGLRPSERANSELKRAEKQRDASYETYNPNIQRNIFNSADSVMSGKASPPDISDPFDVTNNTLAAFNYRPVTKEDRTEIRKSFVALAIIDHLEKIVEENPGAFPKNNAMSRIVSIREGVKALFKASEVTEYMKQQRLLVPGLVRAAGDDRVSDADVNAGMDALLTVGLPRYLAEGKLQELRNYLKDRLSTSIGNVSEAQTFDAFPDAWEEIYGKNIPRNKIPVTRFTVARSIASRGERVTPERLEIGIERVRENPKYQLIGE